MSRGERGECQGLLNSGEGLCRAQLRELVFFQQPRIALAGRFKSPAKALDHLCGRISSFPPGFLPRTDAEFGLFFYMYIFKKICLGFVPVKDLKFKILQ